MTYTTLLQTRGDTRKYRFQRVNADGSVIEDTPDKLFFTVKKNFETEGFIFQKTLADFRIDDEFVYHFIIQPEDTESLKYGDYVYDIEVITDGVVTTLAKGKFILEAEATWAVNQE